MTTLSKSPHDLISECQGLVRALATKIHRQLPAHVDLEDLVGYGQVGLAEAARDFDPERGGQFTTFCYYRVRGAIYDGLSSMSWVKRSVYRRVKYEQMANEVLRLEAESKPGDPEASAEDNVQWLKEVTGLLAIVYLSTRRGGDDADEMDLEDHSAHSPESVALDHELHAKVRQLIESLPPDASFLVKATYFEGLSLTEAGRRLGVGKAWASRLHSKALARLARALRLAGMGD